MVVVVESGSASEVSLAEVPPLPEEPDDPPDDWLADDPLDDDWLDVVAGGHPSA